MNGRSNHSGISWIVVGLAIAASVALFSNSGLLQPSHTNSCLQFAELKTIITPPPPPPPVDSGTVDLRDKKGPLIPRIPSTV